MIRSDGTLIRDYLHVDDTVEAYLALADWVDRTAPSDAGSPADIAFNFSDESPLTVLEIFQAVTAALGAVDPIILGGASDEIPEQHLDATRARTELGWKAQVPLDAGIDRAVEWYRALLS